MSDGVPVYRAVWDAVAALLLAALCVVAGRLLDTMTPTTRAAFFRQLRDDIARMRD